MRALVYSGLVALVFYGGFSMERESVRVIMELQNDPR